jgi:hypothetical protein
MSRLLGKTDLEDSLQRLDKLTHEEARMAIAQNLKATHTVGERVRGVEAKVVGVDDRVAGVEVRVTNVNDIVASVDGRVAGIDERVAVIDSRVAGVDYRVKGVDDRAAGIDRRVRAVDDKVAAVVAGMQTIFGQSPGTYSTLIYLDAREGRVINQQTANDVDQVKRLLPRSFIGVNLEPYASLQGTSCGGASTNGFPRQTPPQTKTLHVPPITREERPGSFKEASSRNGRQQVHFFGSMENVCLLDVPRIAC